MCPEANTTSNNHNEVHNNHLPLSFLHNFKKTRLVLTQVISSFSSLSLVGSSISSDREHLVREHVGIKMSQGTLYKSSGLVTNMDPEYVCPVGREGERGGRKRGECVRMSLGTHFILSCVSRSFPPPSQSYISRIDAPLEGDQEKQFIVCFVYIGKQGLDLYPSCDPNYCRPCDLYPKIM